MSRTSASIPGLTPQYVVVVSPKQIPPLGESAGRPQGVVRAKLRESFRPRQRGERRTIYWDCEASSNGRGHHSRAFDCNREAPRVQGNSQLGA